mgnify:CR=1 FL=1
MHRADRRDPDGEQNRRQRYPYGERLADDGVGGGDGSVGHVRIPVLRDDADGELGLGDRRLGLFQGAADRVLVAAVRRDSVKSTEAGLKYFVLGALSSGILLYGASLTYGYAGTTLFSGILSTLDHGAPLGLLIGLVFMLAGLAFKVSAAPFHMWTPDVYEGSPTPVTAFFATAPKVAAMALLARLSWDAFGAIPGDWTQVLAALAVISMFLGAVAAIGQRDIKRLMAYSSIAHMGYALVGLAAGTAEGVQAMLIYMAIWGLWTALLRPLSGEPFWETVERAPNYLVPFALLAVGVVTEVRRSLTRQVREDHEAIVTRLVTSIQGRGVVDERSYEQGLWLPPPIMRPEPPVAPPPLALPRLAVTPPELADYAELCA